jgi:hypothetical protein
MNFLKLYYGVKYFISLDCPNNYEQELWEQLTYHKNPNIFRCFYITDMFSHTLKEAVFLAGRILEYGDKMVFHCYAGYGRTGTAVLFAYILLKLDKLLANYKKLKNIQAKEIVKEQITEFLKFFNGNMDNLKLLTNLIYPNNYTSGISGIPADEIFDHYINKSIPDDVLYFNNLLNHRINAMYVAIIHAITNKYKGDEFDWLNEISVVLTVFDPVKYNILTGPNRIKNSTDKIPTKFSIDEIYKTIDDKLATTYLTIDNFFYIKPNGETEFNGSTSGYGLENIEGIIFDKVINDLYRFKLLPTVIPPLPTTATATGYNALLPHKVAPGYGYGYNALLPPGYANSSSKPV